MYVTSDNEDDKVQSLYEDITMATQQDKVHYTLLIGDFHIKLAFIVDEAKTTMGPNSGVNMLLRFIFQHGRNAIHSDSELILPESTTAEIDLDKSS